MARRFAPLELDEVERAELTSLASRRSTAQGLALRVRIILACAEFYRSWSSIRNDAAKIHRRGSELPTMLGYSCFKNGPSDGKPTIKAHHAAELVGKIKGRDQTQSRDRKWHGGCFILLFSQYLEVQK